MKFQDEFARRLNAVRGVGDGGEDKGPSTGSGRTDTAPAPRHAELDSASRATSNADSDKADRIPDQVRDDEVPTPTTRHNGWHPELRVKFLEALAQTGNVQASAYFVQRSRQSAYDLKRRDPDFARAWLAALVLAREEAQDKLQERAIEGVEEEIFYHGEVVATRRRYDSRLLLAHLARLDKIAAEIPAQRGAARFGDMLEAIGKGEDTAPLIATPTEEELAVRAAEAEAGVLAEAGPEPQAAEPEDGAQFYEIRWPEDDGPPDYYRITPEAAAAMEREVPGLVAKATGITDEALINSLIFDAQVLAECGLDDAIRANRAAEEGKNL